MPPLLVRTLVILLRLQIIILRSLYWPGTIVPGAVQAEIQSAEIAITLLNQQPHDGGGGS